MDEETKAEEGTGEIVPHEPVTVTLVYPIKFGEQTITELKFRPLTGKEMRLSSGSARDLFAQSTLLEYAGILSGQPLHIIDLLQGVDAIEVIEAITGFFIASRKTGPK